MKGNNLSHSFFWSALERFSVQIIQFIIGIILARILSPKEYGVLGILLVVNSFLQIFVDSGFTKALIQKNNRTKQDFDSVFVFNVFISVICYFILFFIAPIIEKFYVIDQLTLYLRIIGLSLVLNSLYAVIQTQYIISLNFKIIAKVNLLSAVFSGIIAVFLAYNGYGIWALIYQILLKGLCSLVLFIFWYKQGISFSYNHKALKSLYGFGSNILYGSLLNVVVNNLATISIGKVFNIKELGFFSRGTQFTDVAYGTVSSITDNVLLPTFSSIGENKEELRVEFVKMFRILAIFYFPVFILLFVLAEPLILVLLGEKWLPAVGIMQFFALARLVSLLAGINVSAIYSVGRSDLVLKQQFVKILVRVLFIIIALPYGIYYVALAELLSTIVHFFINTYYPGKIFRFSGWDQVRSIYKVFISSISYLLIYWIGISFNLGSIKNIFLVVCFGSVFYFLTLYILGMKEVKELDFKKIVKL